MDDNQKKNVPSENHLLSQLSSTTFYFPLLWTWVLRFHLFVLLRTKNTKQHANLTIYQHLKSGNPDLNLNHVEWSSSESVSFPETPTTDHTHWQTHSCAHTHTHLVVPCVTHVPHRGESSVPRANRLIMMPIHYQALQRPLPLFSIHSLRVAWDGHSGTNNNYHHA